MKSTQILLCFMLLSFLPTLSQARGIPLFFNTGDEIFEVKNAPDLGDGFKLGYACKHFGLFGADLWSWDCELLAVNKADFSAADLGSELKTKYEGTYPLSSRERSFWNHYGIIAMLLLVGGYIVFTARSA